MGVLVFVNAIGLFFPEQAILFRQLIQMQKAPSGARTKSNTHYIVLGMLYIR